MSGLALALHQFRYDQKIFWRNPASVFFTVMFPVMFLVIFVGVIVNGDTIHAPGGIDATHLLRAGDDHPGRRLGDDGQNLAMSLTIDCARAGSSSALPGNAAAELGVHRRPDRQRDRHLPVDVRPGDRARADPASASRSPGDGSPR